LPKFFAEGAVLLHEKLLQLLIHLRDNPQLIGIWPRWRNHELLELQLPAIQDVEIWNRELVFRWNLIRAPSAASASANDVAVVVLPPTRCFGSDSSVSILNASSSFPCIYGFRNSTFGVTERH
jgi:hypothetical protein